MPATPAPTLESVAPLPPLSSEFTGFANPRVQNGGFRSIRFGLKSFF
jgi:hypothetical protein